MITHRAVHAVFCSVIFVLAGAMNAYASYDEAFKLFIGKKYSESLKTCANDLVAADDFKPESQNYKIRFLAAHNHWNLGNTESAIAHFKRCMEIRKDTVDPYMDMALLLISLKRLNDAEEILRRGLKIKEEPMLYYLQGKISLIRKNYWRAKEFFEKTNSVNQELYESYNDLGIALMYLKKYTQANTAFLVAYALKSDSPEIINNIGLSLEKSEKYKEAIEYFKKANTIDKENRIIIENLNRIKQHYNK